MINKWCNIAHINQVFLCIIRKSNGKAKTPGDGEERVEGWREGAGGRGGEGEEIVKGGWGGRKDSGKEFAEKCRLI